MFELVSEIGVSIASNVAQFIAGCLLSIPLYYFAEKKLKNIKPGVAGDILLIAAFSLLGAALPLGPYGVVPLFGALVSAGLRPFAALPLLAANSVFNMLIPYNDVSFAWRLGAKRVVLALAAAILAGLLLRMLKDGGRSLLRAGGINAPGVIAGGKIKVLSILSANIGLAGPFVIVGVSFDVILHKYLWWDIITFITHNSYTDFLPGFFARYNVANPFFLLAITLAFVLLDLARTSAYAVIFRLKGLVIYYAYFAALILLLGISAFI